MDVNNMTWNLECRRIVVGDAAKGQNVAILLPDTTPQETLRSQRVHASHQGTHIHYVAFDQ